LKSIQCVYNNKGTDIVTFLTGMRTSTTIVIIAVCQGCNYLCL